MRLLKKCFLTLFSFCKKMKLGKASGPSGIGAEMLKAAGEAGELWVTDMCNATRYICITFESLSIPMCSNKY